MKKFLLVLFVLTTVVSARMEVSIPGVSVHFGPGIDNAPRKIDDAGIFVLNPGLGLGYDFRDDPKTTAFSFLASGVYFLDCQNCHMLTVGAGGRGRVMATDKLSFDFNLIPSIAWIEGSESAFFLPVITAGVNYHYHDRFTFGMTFAFVPAFNDQDSNLGFFAINLSF